VVEESGAEEKERRDRDVVDGVEVGVVGEGEDDDEDGGEDVESVDDEGEDDVEVGVGGGILSSRSFAWSAHPSAWWWC
jgi:hypothetical protein